MLSFILLALLPLTALYIYFFTEKHSHFPLRGSRVVITGGSAGIGLATAELLVKEYGCHVIIIARNESRLASALNELKAVNSSGATVDAISADVSKPDSIDRGIQKAIEKFDSHPIDVLICNAGTSYPHLFVDTPIETFESQMQLNYLGTVYTVKSAITSLKQSAKQRKHEVSRIVIVSSLGGLTGIAGYTAYSPTKFALRGFAEALHMESRVDGVHVSICCPPDVDTPGFAEENKVKPRECTLISEGTGVFPASALARSIANNLEQYRFAFSTGFDGWILTVLCAGTAPASSVLRSICELALMGVLRIVFLPYRHSYNAICERVAAERRAGKAVDANNTSSSTRNAAGKEVGVR